MNNPKKMKKLLVAFALPDEVVPVNLPGWETVTVVTRISKPYAAARLAKAVAETAPDLVINIGSAGTMVRSVGDILVCTRFLDRDVAKQSFDSISPRLDMSTPLADAFPSVIDGVPSPLRCLCNTGEDFVTADDPVEGDAVDMEAFADALVAQEFGVPFFAVKYVTDVIGQNSMEIWEQRLACARVALTEYFKKVASGLNV